MCDQSNKLALKAQKEKWVYLQLFVVKRVDIITPFESAEDDEFGGVINITRHHSNIWV